MKIDVKEAKVTTNVPQENVTAMSISVDGMEHIMTLLTNLYKDPELAVIREYYTNAVDAHVEAGVDTAVKVSLPTWDNPTYVVQDFGVGMSKDDIVNIYAQYGASTKRNTNDQVGAFGLGCKSALTITQQFTLISIKDGYKTTALIAKSESGINTVNIVSNVPTKDGNGTTIKIPVSSYIHGFTSKAHKFFAFSKPGSVLVDGVQPEYALDSAQKIENPDDPDMVVYLKARADGESYVIMGSVPYALSINEIELSLNRLGVYTSRGFVRMPKYFPVPIGSVDLTPSREGLRFTDKTNDLIDTYMSFIVNDLKAIAIKEIDATETLEDFFDAHKRWNDIVSIKCEHNGKTVPRELKLDATARTITRTSWGSSSHSESDWIRLDKGDKRIVVNGYSADNYRKLNGYLTPYMTAEGLTHATFLITDSKDIHTNEWVAMSSNFTYIDGSDIIEKGREQRKLERQTASKTNGTAKRSKITYPVLFVDEDEVRWVNHDEIAQDTPYLQVSTDLFGGVADMIRSVYRNQGSNRTVGSTVSEYFTSVTDATEIILLGNSRTVKALEQRVKQTRSILPEIEASATNIKVLITDELTKYHAVAQSSWKRFLTSSGVDRHIKEVKDPEIIEIINPPQTAIDAYEKFENTKAAMNYFAYRGMPAVPYIDISSASKVVTALDKKYPLVNSVNTWNLDKVATKHMVKYFNLIHEEHTV